MHSTWAKILLGFFNIFLPFIFWGIALFWDSDILFLWDHEMTSILNLLACHLLILRGLEGIFQGCDKHLLVLICFITLRVWKIVCCLRSMVIVTHKLNCDWWGWFMHLNFMIFTTLYSEVAWLQQSLFFWKLLLYCFVMSI